MNKKELARVESLIQIYVRLIKDCHAVRECALDVMQRIEKDSGIDDEGLDICFNCYNECLSSADDFSHMVDIVHNVIKDYSNDNNITFDNVQSDLDC